MSTIDCYLVDFTLTQTGVSFAFYAPVPVPSDDVNVQIQTCKDQLSQGMDISPQLDCLQTTLNKTTAAFPTSTADDLMLMYNDMISTLKSDQTEQGLTQLSTFYNTTMTSTNFKNLPFPPRNTGISTPTESVERTTGNSISDKINSIDEAINDSTKNSQVMQDEIDAMISTITSKAGNYGNISSEYDRALEIEVDGGNTSNIKLKNINSVTLNDTSKEGLVAIIQNLEKQNAILQLEMDKMVSENKVDQTRYLEIMNQMAANETTIKKLRSKTGRTGYYANNNILSNLVSGISKGYSESPATSVSKALFSGVPYTKGLTPDQKKELKAEIETLKKKMVPITDPAADTGDVVYLGKLSTLHVYTVKNDATSIILNYNGVIQDTEFSGTMTIPISILYYSTYQAYTSSLSLNDDQKSKICAQYGITYTGNSQQLWNAYLVFLYTYLSIISYLLSNSENFLGYDQLNYGNTSNITSFISPNGMNNISNVSFPVSSQALYSDSKKIMSYSSNSKWPIIMFKNTNTDLSANSTMGSSISSTLQKIIGKM